MIAPRSRACLLVLAVCLLASPAAAQTPLILPPGSPGLLPEGDQPRRAPLTITPTLTITGEYNDNIFQNNDDKVSDFILGLSPGISLVAESSIYRLLASYSFTSEIYADENQLNDAFARQTFLVDGSYRLTPALTVSLSEALYQSKNSNVVAAENISTGRTRSTTNTLSPGVIYQVTPQTALRGLGTWTLQRYDSDGGLDSDTLAVEGFVDHALTPRLTLIGGYQFAYFIIEATPDTATHTPRFGASYRFTPTLTGTLTAGPTVIVPENDSVSVTPAVTAALQARFSWGSATLQYDRAVGTSGGLGGTSENQSIGAIVQVDRLVRGLILQAVPRYTSSRNTSGAQNRVDVDTVSLILQGRYQINRWVAAVAGYNFNHQRSSGSVTTSSGTVTAADMDQNRVFFGVQLGYPIVFD